MSSKSFDLKKFYDKNSLIISLFVIALVVISSFAVAPDNPTGAAIKWPNSINPPIIINYAPVAVASAIPTSGTAPLSVYFSANDSYDLDGNITNYSWRLGDGSTGFGRELLHTYSVAGDYIATLYVTDDDNAMDTDSVLITVTEAPYCGDGICNKCNPIGGELAEFCDVCVADCGTCQAKANQVILIAGYNMVYTPYAGSVSYDAAVWDTEATRIYENCWPQLYSGDILLPDQLYSIYVPADTLWTGDYSNATCTDTDGGIEYYVQGTTTTSNDSKTDSCSTAEPNSVNEYYCDGNAIGFSIYECPDTCSNGACVNTTPCSSITLIEGSRSGDAVVLNWTECTGADFYRLNDRVIGGSTWSWTDDFPNTYLSTPYPVPVNKEYRIIARDGTSADLDGFENSVTIAISNTLIVPPTPVSNCTDTDGGIDYYVNGTVTINNDTLADFCYDSIKLREYYCDGDNLGYVNYDCPSGCSVDACANTTNATDTTPPYVSIAHSPITPTTVDPITFTASAADSNGLISMSIYIDGVNVKTCLVSGTNAMCTYATTLSAGSHSYFAEAYDGANPSNIGTSSTGTVSVTATATCDLAYFTMVDILNEDVTPECQACGYTNDYFLDTYGNALTANMYGPTMPPARSLCAEIVPGWFAGNEWHRKFCSPDNNWYWVEYPANLTQETTTNVTGLHVSSVNTADTGFTLVWNNVTGADSYNLYMHSEFGPSPGNVVGAPTVSTYYDGTPDNLNACYYYSVSAVNSGIEGLRTSEVEACF